MRSVFWWLTAVLLSWQFAVAPSMAMEGGKGGAGAEEEEELHVFSWYDCFDSEVINDFQKRHHCRVVLDYFDSNEAMYDMLQKGGADYDVLTPSSYMIKKMHADGVLLPLDHKQLPNLANLIPNAADLTEDPKMEFSIPFAQYVTGIAYDATKMSADDVSTWSVFGNGGNDRSALLADMREAIGMALKFLGHSANSVDPLELRKAGRLLVEWSRNVRWLPFDQAIDQFKAGKLAFAHMYNSDAALLMDENPNFAFSIPREGVILSSDDFVIPAASPLPELAHAFIDFMLDPENAKKNMEGVRNFMPNAPALELLDKTVRDNPAFTVSPEIMKRSEVLQDLGEDTALYEEVWRDVLSN